MEGRQARWHPPQPLQPQLQPQIMERVETKEASVETEGTRQTRLRLPPSSQPLPLHPRAETKEASEETKLAQHHHQPPLRPLPLHPRVETREASEETRQTRLH